MCSLNILILPFFRVLIPIFFSFLFTNLSFSKPSNITDHQALVSFKTAIVSDPLLVIASWNESTHFCSWEGVRCGKRHQRVVEIYLGSSKLQGQLSPSIGNLSFLKQLHLGNNDFTGIIPEEIGRLSRLQILVLGNNSFSGEIPKNVSQCLDLTYLSLGGNKLIGTIPKEFLSFSKLDALLIYENFLTGELPPYIGNLSSLTLLSGVSNNFGGSIPDSLGQLKNLVGLFFGSNNFSGTIPKSLYNLSMLTHFQFTKNRLHGNLPRNIGFALPQLTYLAVAMNKLTGPIPTSLSNATKLESLDLIENNFKGRVPDFGGLKSLYWLTISRNPLGNGKSDELSFMYPLLNCTQLQVLVLVNCRFGGHFPSYIGNFSKLEQFSIANNFISGKIPNEIGQLVDLFYLGLSQNQLHGTIPDSIGNLKQLQYLDLGINGFSGEIPSTLGNLSKLYAIYLDSSNLQGTIPANLANPMLSILNLSSNGLSGYIPTGIFSRATSLLAVSMSYNHLTGSLPLEISVSKNLVMLDLSNNKLSGEIPASLHKLIALSTLYMGNNFLSGSIPPLLRSLRSLETLDLSHNNLTGKIPEFLGDLPLLKSLNLSFNALEGEVPVRGIFKNVSGVSIYGNENLCGGVIKLRLPRCIRNEVSPKSRHHFPLWLKIFISCAVVIFVLVVLFMLISYKHRKKLSSSTSSNIDPILRTSYKSIHKATNGFSTTNLIGSGKFGTVYKGRLDENGTIIAIKVLKLHIKGASKSFKVECEALRHIRHRNLVRVLTSCSSVDYRGNDFKAIVFEYMENGSLDHWLHQHYMGCDQNNVHLILSLTQRLNIAIDVACGLDYLHHGSGTPLVHCDLKPSNVLLDKDFVAHICDFGLARFFTEVSNTLFSSESSSLIIKGTIGYIAPENGMGSNFSKRGDVYSYGILLLELFTGRSPTDDSFNNNLTLRNFVKNATPEQVALVCDPLLLNDEANGMHGSSHIQSKRKDDDKIKECLLSIFRIGIACSEELPGDRMELNDAISELQRTKSALRS